MRQILEYILSKSNKNNMSKFPELWEKIGGEKYIPADVIYQYIIDALETRKIKPEDILKEISKYKSLQQLWDVYRGWKPGNLEMFSSFLYTLSTMFENSEYINNETDIFELVFNNSYEIFKEV